MSRTKPVGLVLLAAVHAAATPEAGADYLGVTVELDHFALDGVTPLAELPGYAGEVVVNVYATFSDPDDQAVGVSGSSAIPFDVRTCLGDYVNEELGGDLPPTQAQVDLVPSLNWDSFITIGLKITPPVGHDIIVSPGTPGPNAEDAPGGVWGDGHEDMGWFTPPTQDGLPSPQTLAGPDGRVLLMRLALLPVDEIHGSFGVLVWEGGAPGGTETGAVGDLGGCTCPPDVNFDGVVDVDDHVSVILGWGPSYPRLPQDVNNDSVVDVEDLVLVIFHWGLECP